jgi:methyltransferase
MVGLALYLAILVLVGVQRLIELRISRRNARAMLGRGALEYGRGHLPFLKALHVAFFAGCAGEVILLGRAFHPGLAIAMVAVLLGAQGLRYWAVISLGPRWNIRVIVEPGAPRVTTGPYRFLRHPNYLAVALEGIAIPLIHTAWLTAAVFTVANAWVLLRYRIPCEEAALESVSCVTARKRGPAGTASGPPPGTAGPRKTA